ncbi:glycosyltransferase family 39 protein [Candidatus Woesearchaeota archaeon]|nr:glycosyltransferase family 39 protein [Candidatus Woesearchaeota archaeon]
MDDSKKLKSISSYSKLSACIIILFSAIVFSLAFFYHISGDACWHASVSRFIAEEKKLPLNENLGRDEPFWAPPLFHLTQALIYIIFGNMNIADIIIKFISPLFAILTIIFSYLSIKKIFDGKIAFYSLLFLAFIPLFMDYSIFGYVESMLAFFVIASIYFAISKKNVMASLFLGLGILTKYNAVFIMPALLYIAYKNSKSKKDAIKSMLIILIIPLIIASPWLIRNWIVLGNPVWPFINFIFNGVPSKFSGFDFNRFTSINLITYAYAGFFGIPDGNPKALFFFEIPYINQLIILGIIATLIFISPLIFAFFAKKIKNKALLALWIIPYIFLFLLYVGNVGFSVTRIIMPAIPAIAVLWAYGFGEMLKPKYKKLILAFFILIISAFIFAESAKIIIAANMWKSYNDDFGWIKANTAKNSIFMAGGQCIPYNIERLSVSPNIENLKKSDYAFISQNFKLDKRVAINNTLLTEIKKGKLVYKNNKTGTEIYSSKH